VYTLAKPTPRLSHELRVHGRAGLVHRAVLRPPAGSLLAAAGQQLTVAVKIPVSNATTPRGEAPNAADIERGAALLLEAFVMHGLKHPRIVSLVAVCTHAQPIMVCMEHMRHGDLRSYLRR